MENKKKHAFVFEKENYRLLIIGILVNALGFILMIGGAAQSPDEFNADELFSHRRITVAPIIVLIGYGIVMWSILKRPKQNK
jgi:hypothetical protein